MFYFIINLNGLDVIIVYVKFDVYDLFGFGDQDLYIVYGCMNMYFESVNYEYKIDVKVFNWVEFYGFKIFFLDKIFWKGKLYIGLKLFKGEFIFQKINVVFVFRFYKKKKKFENLI